MTSFSRKLTSNSDWDSYWQSLSCVNVNAASQLEIIGIININMFIRYSARTDKKAELSQR